MNNSDALKVGEIILYKGEDDIFNINVKVQDETVWLTQAQLVKLFGSSKTKNK